MKLQPIIREINTRSKSHPIGRLPELRKRLKSLSRSPGTNIFQPKSTFEHDGYAFHWGGRKELQFNVEFEEGRRDLRHGVAFSFARGRSLPEPGVLVPKVARFNKFLLAHPRAFSGMSMWQWTKSGGSKKSREPAPIELSGKELVQEAAFISLGRSQHVSGIDYEIILSDLDRLLPLYEFVERTSASERYDLEEECGLRFQPGGVDKPTQAIAEIAEKQVSINLRENRLQSALREYLKSRYGSKNVREEQPIFTMRGTWCRVDLVVRSGAGYEFYEAKAHPTDKRCIRSALGQLLEYSFWPGHQQASKLFVVGEAALSAEGGQYLALLRKRFRIPIEYQQFNLAKRKLVKART